MSIWDEDPVPLSEAGNFFPTKDGRHPSYLAVWRKCVRGCMGIKLEFGHDGTRRVTSRAAVLRFCEAVSRAKQVSPFRGVGHKSPEREVHRAKQARIRLTAAGVKLNPTADLSALAACLGLTTFAAEVRRGDQARLPPAVAEHLRMAQLLARWIWATATTDLLPRVLEAEAVRLLSDAARGYPLCEAGPVHSRTGTTLPFAVWANRRILQGLNRRVTAQGGSVKPTWIPLRAGVTLSDLMSERAVLIINEATEEGIRAASGSR